MTNDTLLLWGGTLVDVRTGGLTPDAALVVQGDRISQVGRQVDIVPPAAAHVVDTTDTWLIPGLVDMHVHLPFQSPQSDLLPLYLANGVTTVRDVGGSLTELSLLRQEARSPRRAVPRLYFAGPLLDGMPPLWPNHTILVDTVDRARTAVRMLLAQDVDCIKVYNNVPRDSLTGIVEEAHAAGKLVLGHVPRTLSMSEAVSIGMDCLEHIRVTGRELLSAEEAEKIDHLPLGTRETLLWERFDLESDGIERLIHLLSETRVFLDPTLIVDADMFAGEVQDADAASVESLLPEAVLEALRRDRHLDPLRAPPELKEKAYRGFEKRLRFIEMCNAAGVRLLAGTDTFGPGALLPGVSLHNELELLQRAGLSPLEALRGATITAATALQSEANLGTIETGKIADIAVLDADPLADTRNTRKVRLVVKGGGIHMPADLIGSVGSASDG